MLPKQRHDKRRDGLALFPEVLRVLTCYRRLARIVGPTLAGRAARALPRRLRTIGVKTYFILHHDPLIIYLGNAFRHTMEVAELLRDREVHFIRNNYHTFERDDRRRKLRAEVAAFRERYPRHHIYFICPTETERKLFEQDGLTPAYFINKNAFVDETLFDICRTTPRFDAVHNGQLAPYKRHELAVLVENLAIITYRRRTESEAERLQKDAYAERIRQQLEHAVWLNDGNGFIPPCEIKHYLAQARVGLCLSAEEGPMAASVEYMLCGLPILATPGTGGRDVFFDPRHSLVVDPTPEEVAEGVRELISRRIPREEVRESVLEKIHEHRRRFIALVDDILESHGRSCTFGSVFQEIFVNKLRVSAPFPNAFLVHLGKGMPVDLCKQLAATANQ